MKGLILPGILLSDDFRASFAFLVSNEILTGCSSGEKAPLTAPACDAEPSDNWFDGTKLVRDWSGGVEFE